MKHSVWIGVVAAASVAACGSKSSTEASGGSAVVAKAPGSAGSAAGSGSSAGSAAKPAAKREAKPPPPSKAARAEYRKHMKAGWKLQAEKKWGEAVPEFEAALKAIPDEQRALTELGWSAQNAGDFKTAKTADEKAIAVAVDKKVKAAGYYNLGTVLEKTGDKEGALKAYLASLQLRPNGAAAKVVMAAVGKLGADPTKAPTETGACAKNDPCACAGDLALGVWEDNPACAEAKGVTLPVKGLKAWTYGSPDEGATHYTYLFDDAGHYVAELSSEAEFGRHFAASKTEKMEVKKIGAHNVLWLETSYEDDATYGTETGMDEFHTTGTLVTVCVVDDGKPVSCPVREVPKVSETSESFIPDDGDAEKAKTTKTVLDIALGDDGAATVKLVSGSSAELADGVLGPHKLW